MTVISIILGVLMIIGGFSFIFTPLITFLGTGYFIIILFFVFGAFGLIRGIVDKHYGMEFFFSILSLVLGIAGLVIPGGVMTTDQIILYLAAIWFLAQGAVTIVRSISGKKAGAGTAAVVFGIILGVLEILLGIYSFAHPIVLALAIGWLIGFFFIAAGFNLVMIGGVISRSEESEKETAQEDASPCAEKEG